MDRWVDAQDRLTRTSQAYYVWLEDRKDRVYNLFRDEATSLVVMIRDGDIALLDVNLALIALFLCVG